MKTTQRDFRASKLLKLHKRVIDLLDMIVSCDKHYANAVDFKNGWDKLHWYDWRKGIYSESKLQAFIDKYAAIKERLLRWYNDIMHRINEREIIGVLELTPEEQLKAEQELDNSLID